MLPNEVKFPWKRLALGFLIWLSLIIFTSITYAQVKLPGELQRLQIKFMKVGESGFCRYKAMVVNEEGSCYLEAYIELDELPNNDKAYIKIDRKADGYYVTVRSKKTWLREFIHSEQDKLKRGDLIPVKKIICME